MNKKEFLSEENYQNAKKKITKVSLIILIVGLVIGLGFIVFGVITQNNAKKINEQRYNEAYAESQKRVDIANEKLDDINKQKQELNDQISTKQYECDSLDMSSSTWFADKNKCQSEVNSLETKLNELEMEEFQINNTDYRTEYNPILPIKYILLYIIGGSIIGMSCLISGIIFIIAKRREIRAFAIQQTMPVTQEVIDKMAPTVGNAVGSVAQGITSGIKQGLNNNDSEK